MTKGKGENSPKQNRPTQDNSYQDIQSQDDHLNNSNRHNNNPPYEGSPETQSNKNPDNSSSGDNNANQNTDTGAGVSGRPNSELNHNPAKGTNAPNFQEGPVAGGADNTRGENVPRSEGHGAGAKRAMPDPGPDSPQGSNAYPSDARGADSSDKEFKNNQPNASTLLNRKENEQRGNEQD